MYAGEKSDEVVVPRKRPNKGRQLPAEVVEGRASPEGNSRQAAVVRTLSRAATSIRLAAVRRSAYGFTPCVPPTFDPREEPGALAAHAGICAGGEEKSSSLPRPLSASTLGDFPGVRSQSKTPVAIAYRQGGLSRLCRHFAQRSVTLLRRRHCRDMPRLCGERFALRCLSVKLSPLIDFSD
jgi:hypothetical protein